MRWWQSGWQALAAGRNEFRYAGNGPGILQCRREAAGGEKNMPTPK